MMWFFAILIVLALGGIALVAAGCGRADGARRTTTGPTRACPRDGDARRPTTCAGCGSRWRSAATGCRRSTRCWSGSRAELEEAATRRGPRAADGALMATEPHD